MLLIEPSKSQSCTGSSPPTLDAAASTLASQMERLPLRLASTGETLSTDEVKWCDRAETQKRRSDDITPEQLTALVALDDSDSGLGEVEVTGVDERALDVAPTPADGPADAAAEEAVSSPRTTSTEVAIVPSSPPGAELPTPLAESEESSSDDDVLLSMRYKSVSAASKAKKKSPAGESFIEYSLLLMLNCWQSPLQRHR